MIKIYSLNDDNFFKLLNVDNIEHYSSIKKAVESGFKPYAKIIRKGHISSWYNKHIGELYEIHKIIIETDNSYINFLVKSKGDGSKNGYKPKFSTTSMGKGVDIVHNMCCEIIIVAV